MHSRGQVNLYSNTDVFPLTPADIVLVSWSDEGHAQIHFCQDANIERLALKNNRSL